ncbi:unnamed protein product [Cunninghamella blakesleeana]
MSLTKEETQNIFKSLIQGNKYNKVCFDCQNRRPAWASIDFGIYICQDCAAAHRNLGVHITFVKSIVLDSWSLSQMEKMKCGGNQAANESLGNIMTKDIQQKYNHKLSQQYKLQLQKKTELSLLQQQKEEEKKKEDMNLLNTIDDDNDIFSINNNNNTSNHSSNINNTVRKSQPIDLLMFDDNKNSSSLIDTNIPPSPPSLDTLLINVDHSNLLKKNSMNGDNEPFEFFSINSNTNTNSNTSNELISSSKEDDFFDKWENDTTNNEKMNSIHTPLNDHHVTTTSNNIPHSIEDDFFNKWENEVTDNNNNNNNKTHSIQASLNSHDKSLSTTNDNNKTISSVDDDFFNKWDNGANKIDNNNIDTAITNNNITNSKDDDFFNKWEKDANSNNIKETIVVNNNVTNSLEDDFFNKWENESNKPTTTTPTRIRKFQNHKHKKNNQTSRLGARKVEQGTFQYEASKSNLLNETKESLSSTFVNNNSSNNTNNNNNNTNTNNNNNINNINNNIPSFEEKSNKPISSRFMFTPTTTTNTTHTNTNGIMTTNTIDTINNNNDNNNKKHISASLSSVQRNDRLGMVSDRWNYHHDSTTNQERNGNNNDNDKDENDGVTVARDRFGNAKSISSDQYFGRNEYDTQVIAERSMKLSKFQGATSISSDQYFDRSSSPSSNNRYSDTNNGYVRGSNSYQSSNRSSYPSSNGNPLSKKILNVAAKGASKIQRALSDLERRV